MQCEKGLALERLHLKKNAILSSCRLYRYALWRIWDESKGKVMFIGLNPSTADETEDDRTISRCISYSKQWGYGGIIMGNLFAFRTPSPAEMISAEDPIGEKNDYWLKRLANEAALVVGMWGNSGAFLGRSEEVIAMFPGLHCLRLTKTGQPHHTRGLPDGIKAVPYIR